MGPQFTESSDGIHYRGESLSPLARGFVLLMAVAMFVIPVTFVVLVPWTTPTWSMLLAVLAIVAFAALGATFAWMGLASVKEAVFDARRRVLRIALSGPLGNRDQALPFEAIESIVVQRSQGMEDPDVFQLRVQIMARKRPYRLGMFGTQCEAESWQARLQSLLSAEEGPP